MISLNMMRRVVNPAARATVLSQRMAAMTVQPRRFLGDYEAEKTTATVLNQEADVGLMVDAYSQVGFRLNNGMQVVGPMVIFPRSVLSWQVRNSEEINEDSLSLFCLLEPKIDILVVGVGDRGNKVAPRIIHYMKNKGISLEVLPTESAITTFNFLNQERRYVAGAFIPPMSLRVTDEDLVASQRQRNKLFLSQQEDAVF